MTYYVLQVHARDVNISENIGDIGRHTGFDLLEYNGDEIIGIHRFFRLRFNCCQFHHPII